MKSATLANYQPALRKVLAVPLPTPGLRLGIGILGIIQARSPGLVFIKSGMGETPHSDGTPSGLGLHRESNKE